MNQYLEMKLQAYAINELENDIIDMENCNLETNEDDELNNYLDARDSGQFDEDECIEIGDCEDEYYEEDFKDDYYEEDFEDDRVYCGSEWTLEDSWDALTDGMYGDYPSDPRVFDAVMDAMGF